MNIHKHLSRLHAKYHRIEKLIDEGFTNNNEEAYLKLIEEEITQFVRKHKK